MLERGTGFAAIFGGAWWLAFWALAALPGGDINPDFYRGLNSVATTLFLFCLLGIYARIQEPVWVLAKVAIASACTGMAILTLGIVLEAFRWKWWPFAVGCGVQAAGLILFGATVLRMKGAYRWSGALMLLCGLSLPLDAFATPESVFSNELTVSYGVCWIGLGLTILAKPPTPPHSVL